jgi:hypothetical protein
MIVEKAFVGARGIDSLPFSQAGTAAEAKRLATAGTDFVVGYLGAMTPKRLQDILSAGLAFMPVTYAGAYANGATDEIAQLKALGIPQGCTVWLDLEGPKAFKCPPGELIATINMWADAISSAGYIPGLYVGSPQPLTSGELYGLRVVRYWNALSREADRNGALAEPSCGWCMWQMHPSVTWGGVWSDVNMIGQDFKGRLPSWVVA